MRPVILTNCAITADGKVAIGGRLLASGSQPASFTSKQDRRRLLEIRAKADAILVGHQTLKIDNPPMSLSATDLRKSRSDRGLPEYPMRIVISASGEISPELAIFDHPVAPTVIFSTIRMPPCIREQLATKAILHLVDAQRVDLNEMLDHLYRAYNVRILVCEGGPNLFRQLVEIDAIDGICLTISPKIFGGFDSPGFLGPPGPFLKQSKSLRLSSMKVVGDECFLEYSRL